MHYPGYLVLHVNPSHGQPIIKQLKWFEVCRMLFVAYLPFTHACMCKVEFNNHFCLSACQLKILKLISPYCPRQAPMGAHSLSTKNWGWAVSQRRCLNGSTFLMEGPTPKVSCLRTKLTSILALPMLCHGQPDGGKSCKVDQLIALLPSFRIIHCF